MSLNVLVRGEGSPLLLLHGFTGSARSWSQQADGWVSSHRVIAPDLLGHAGSEAPREPARYALEQQAADLADLLELMDATPATVVGYSMGARLALVMALLHPSFVERLVLESPSAGIADPVARAQRQAADDRLAADIERDGVEAFVKRWERLPMFASHAQLPLEVRERWHRERLGHEAHGLAASLRGAGQGSMPALQARLRDIATPTLLVAGALDEVGLARARALAAAMPDAALQIIAAAGHTPHLEQPESFTVVVDEFMNATAAPRTH